MSNLSINDIKLAYKNKESVKFPFFKEYKQYFYKKPRKPEFFKKKLSKNIENNENV